MAWNIQTADVPERVWVDIDIDKECLECLEEEMFERSLLAGVVGNFQWGLRLRLRLRLVVMCRPGPA